MFAKRTVFGALMRVLVTVAFLVGVVAAQGAPVAESKTGSTPAWVDGVTLVQFNSGVTLSTAQQTLDSCGTVFEKQIDRLGAWVVRVPKGRVQTAVACLQGSKHVTYAEPDYLAEATFTPNDPSYPIQQYAPQKIQANLAWDISKGSSSVVVAVVDSGADFGHPDLQGKLIAGWDFVNSDADPSDDNGHGTHVAGIIVAATNNGQGIAGIAGDTRVLVVKVLTANGSASYSNIASGIIYAADQGARIINLSAGGPIASSTLQNAVDYAWNKGALVVAATGNGDTSALFYPAAYANAMAVAATDEYDARWSSSNFGSYISVSAPGSNVYSTYWQGSGSAYATTSGTSMAAPHVAGVAALLLAQDGTRSNAQLRSLIESTADDLGAAGRDDYFGHGRVNACQAVGGACGSAPIATPAPPTATPAPPTATPVPPTATAVPPTATSVPPTATPAPPTATPVPPTATAVPPTATAVPPTATPVPPTATPALPTATSVPPTATAVPPTATPALPTATPAPAASVRVNNGGSSFTDGAGKVWAPDQAWKSTFGYIGGVAMSFTTAVNGTTDDALYQKQRQGLTEYRYAVANGTYKVTLRFADFESTKTNDRIMKITIEGSVVAKNALSVFAQVGARTALDKTYQTTVSDGYLNILFAKNGGKKPTMVSAILVEKVN